MRDVVVARGSTPVLTNVGLDVDAAESVAISGASGCGKSTLLAAIAGLVTPEQGEIRVDGMLHGRSARRRASIRLHKIGIVFQGDEFLPELTLAENVCLPSMLRDRSFRLDGHRPEVERLFRRLRIAGLASRRPAEVSAGQLQRAAVARAVLGRPAVVLADEPTSSLDHDAARDALALLLDLAVEGGAAVCVVTHDPAIAQLCDRRLQLRDGELSAVGAPEQTDRA